MNDGRPSDATSVVRLVARREVIERLRARSFAVATGLLVVVIIAIGVISRLGGDGGDDAIEVATAGELPIGFEDMSGQTAGLFERTVEITGRDDAAAARAAVEDGDADVAVIGDRGEVVFDDGIDEEVLAILQQAWANAQVQQALGDAGLDEQQVRAALTTTPLEPVTIDGEEDSDEGLAILTGTLAGILLFISLQTFGTYVLTGVVEEKATAVVELLLVRARGSQMLAGKVIGIGIAALLQFALAIVAALVSLAISDVEVPGEIWAALPITLVWFIGGYALYSTLFALAGSLVSRQEDAQAAAMPIMSVLLLAYVMVFTFGSDPESTASTVMSILPPIAPLLMPLRMAAGAASVIEVLVALVLLAAAILAAWAATGRIYEQVLLRRGTRISWRDAASLIRRT
ncbi:ABC transporter permease [Acidimicrobiia bacterium EGI L10123]|uniref:ABC transporter permease n=1 Tax=Salinilacustrithrix flava TaxID=2957203 RepID=UPI003D7C207B|nr:ABC transporter permease [Acidimicrobiia bacterium EGI L10123]